MGCALWAKGAGRGRGKWSRREVPEGFPVGTGGHGKQGGEGGVRTGEGGGLLSKTKRERLVVPRSPGAPRRVWILTCWQ